MMSQNKPNVFLVCTGVGHINRGYESFTKECFEALKGNDNFDLYLLKGAGNSSGREVKINCILRNSATALFISRITKKEAYHVEQATFLIGMLPALFRYKPSVIYYSDFILGTYLWHLRKIFGFRYKLLFSNGAPNRPPFTRMDHVQQLLPMYVQDALLKNTPAGMLTLLPYAINIQRDVHKDISVEAISILRKRLQLPVDKKVLISVGAVNSHHKRMDYVINEFANLDPKRYFLLILGQIDEQSEPILKLAETKLLKSAYLVKQVKNDEVNDYMLASDYFILASLKEGLPRVLPEALKNGLLPIVHDYDVTRETLGELGVYLNLTKGNTLAAGIDEVDRKNIPKEKLMGYAYNTYSWDKLESQYANMILKAIV